MKNNFENILNKDIYQVFLFSSPTAFPYPFAVHPWFVVNNKGVLSRFEIWKKAGFSSLSDDHLCKNLFTDMTIGLKIFPYFSDLRWKSKVIKYIEGGEDSVAYKMIEFFNNKLDTYPFRFNYHLFPGPNSNTFGEWIIEKFPESEFKLPLNAIGKSYKS